MIYDDDIITKDPWDDDEEDTSDSPFWEDEDDEDLMIIGDILGWW